MMNMGMCLKMNGVGLLATLGLGYIVCYLANREEKFLRTLGYSIGTFMIVISCILLLAKAASFAQLGSKMCPMKGGMGMMSGPESGMKGKGIMGTDRRILMREQEGPAAKD